MTVVRSKPADGKATRQPTVNTRFQKTSTFLELYAVCSFNFLHCQLFQQGNNCGTSAVYPTWACGLHWRPRQTPSYPALQLFPPSPPPRRAATAPADTDLGREEVEHFVFERNVYDCWMIVPNIIAIPSCPPWEWIHFLRILRFKIKHHNEIIFSYFTIYNCLYCWIWLPLYSPNGFGPTDTATGGLNVCQTDRRLNFKHPQLMPFFL